MEWEGRFPHPGTKLPSWFSFLNFLLGREKCNLVEAKIPQRTGVWDLCFGPPPPNFSVRERECVCVFKLFIEVQLTQDVNFSFKRTT